MRERRLSPIRAPFLAATDDERGITYRCETLPANLLQGQRDYFGAHTFERVDKPRGKKFHVEWGQPGRPMRQL